MPFRPDRFLTRLERLRRLRRRPWIGYGVAIVAVGASILAGMAASELLAAGPFLIFCLAIILAATIGGPRAGVLAAITSSFAVDYFFLSSPHAWTFTPSALMPLALFGIVAFMQVGLVSLLDRAIDRLWRQADNIRFVLDAEPTGVIAVDEAGLVQLVNRAVEQQFGYLRSELLGQSVDILLPKELRDGHSKLRATFLQNPETRPMGVGRDLQGRHKDGTTMPVEVGLNPFERDGRRGALATVADISERKAIERRQQVLMDEVRHRGRNLLAVVQAIAMRTMTDDRTVAQARKQYLATIQALARTHDLFLATTTAPLASIVKGELAPFADRATIEGCDVMLSQTAAQDFALIVHELTTNAVKHGALSAPEGVIAVSGHQDGEHLRFVWEESGGPPPKQPTRQGFGHTILNDVAHGFCIHVSVDYRPEGLRYELEAELGRVTNLVELSIGRTPT
ncbi:MULTISPECIES: PAS domain S-box protein [Alphaproteobacteria]|uniref:sensor histidine kinase n=1 Tax=Alphaproteobacteria TaxID=28211 RepID=UPI0025F99205|nr:PAS domain S-box protein [Phenylobacterium sp.]MBT9472562.1 PAS domain S-box protein [Phenylobacterium sp.]